MGRIVATFFVSADGTIERPDQFVGPYFDEALGEVVNEALCRQQAFLLGRHLYDEWSQHWPGNTSDPFAHHINSIPKHVVSSTLTEATWDGTTVIPGDGAAERVRELKASTEGDIGMSGSATTVRWLLAEGLLDEIAMLVFPVVQGRGQARLFDETPRALELLHAAALPSGVVHLRYGTAPQA